MAKTQEYEIDIKGGPNQIVTGLVINNRWGIDKRTTETVRTMKNGEQRVSLSSCFYLTHIPTGLLVTNANTQRALKELVNREDMINEDDPKKIVKAVGEFWNERGWRG